MIADEIKCCTINCLVEKTQPKFILNDGKQSVEAYFAGSIDQQHFSKDLENKLVTLTKWAAKLTGLD